MKHIKTFVILVATVILFVAFSVISASAASCNLKAKVTDNNVNIRTGAGTSNKVITTLNKKTTVTLKNTKLYNKSWYKIKLSNGKKGYIHKNYLKIKKNQIFIPKTKSIYAGYSAKYNVINTTGTTPTFTSSNSSVATVSSNGKITSYKNGTVTITAKAKNKTSSSTLTVKNATVTLGTVPTTCFLDDTFTISATCPKVVTYSSSDTSIATVSSKGVVTPKKAGTVTFTVSSKSDSKTFKVKFTERVITLSVSKTSLYAGCYATIVPSGGKYDYTYKSSDTNVLTVSNSGLVTAVGAGTAKVTVTSGTLTKTQKFTVTSGTSVNISHKTGTVNQGMTLYLTSSTSGVTWSSSNTSVATVDGGFVLGRAKGTAIITASTSSGAVDCFVTVTDPECVRFVYTSENSASLGDTVTFYAITDTLRSNVKFEITDPNGNVSKLKNPTKITEDGRYIWSASKALTVAGKYTVVAYSKTASSSYQTCSSGDCTTFVNSTTDRKAVAYGERRATTDLINLIANYEGFVGTVYSDTIAGGVPTVGYGRVVYKGATFYNGMTKKEAFAFLVNTVNESGYTSQVNKVLTSNKIKFSQYQFDALVDFSYNLGAYSISNNSELLNTLLDSYGSESYKKTGFVSTYNAKVKKKADSTSATLATLLGGTEVTLVNTTVYDDNWYKIQLDEETIGYIQVSDITRRTTNTEVRNLNNVKLDTFAKNYLAYHHASGNCYKGLLYRRVDEIEVFFFGDYLRDGNYNYYKLSYTCSSNSSFKL